MYLLAIMYKNIYNKTNRGRTYRKFTAHFPVLRSKWVIENKKRTNKQLVIVKGDSLSAFSPNLNSFHISSILYGCSRYTGKVLNQLMTLKDL